jgi:hypothetical protein
MENSIGFKKDIETVNNLVSELDYLLNSEGAIMTTTEVRELTKAFKSGISLLKQYEKDTKLISLLSNQ